MDQTKKGSRFWTRRRMLLVPVAIAAGVLLIPGIAAAWFSWSGIDPVIDLGNGKGMAIYVEMQRFVGCNADKDIDISVQLPKGYTGAQVATESSLTYDCDNDPNKDTYTNTVATRTRLIHVGDGQDNTARVAVRISSTETGRVCVFVQVGKASKVGSPSFQGVPSVSVSVSEPCPVPDPKKGVTLTTFEGTSDNPVIGRVSLG